MTNCFVFRFVCFHSKDPKERVFSVKSLKTLNKRSKRIKKWKKIWRSLEKRHKNSKNRKPWRKPDLNLYLISILVVFWFTFNLFFSIDWYLQEKIESETTKSSQQIKEQLEAFKDKLSKGLEEAQRTEFGKKAGEMTEEFSKQAKSAAEALAKSGEQISKSEAFKSVSQVFNWFSFNCFLNILSFTQTDG